MTEHRKFERHRTSKVGKIVFNHGSPPIDCTVRNFSPSGACLIVENVAKIPANFTLVMTRDRITWPCRVVWRSVNRLGVSFDPATRETRRQPALAAQTH
jgi:hypothetical protein